jgi:hypothetical protein
MVERMPAGGFGTVFRPLTILSCREAQLHVMRRRDFDVFPGIDCAVKPLLPVKISRQPNLPISAIHSNHRGEYWLAAGWCRSVRMAVPAGDFEAVRAGVRFIRRSRASIMRPFGAGKDPTPAAYRADVSGSDTDCQRRDGNASTGKLIRRELE